MRRHGSNYRRPLTRHRRHLTCGGNSKKTETACWHLSARLGCALRVRDCRYTGPYYLTMIVPVLVLGIISAGIYGWISLGVIIVGGSGLIWWATERTWGKFS